MVYWFIIFSGIFFVDNRNRITIKATSETNVLSINAWVMAKVKARPRPKILALRPRPNTTAQSYSLAVRQADNSWPQKKQRDKERQRAGENRQTERHT